MRIVRKALLPLILIGGCTAATDAPDAANAAAGQAQAPRSAQSDRPFQVEEVAQFAEPWAMTFLPNGLLLVSEKRGALRFIDFMDEGPSQRLGSISGVPAVDYGGQGGFGDVVPHPDFARNNLLYLSYVEGEGDNRGAAVARARLVLDEADAGRLEDLQVIWRQSPKMSGRGHYGHRLAFSPDGRHLFISSGDRQEFTPAQDMNANLGKILRLNPDGSVPADNPFVGRAGWKPEIWSTGHRNPLGLTLHPETGEMWETEFGPRGGDELNFISRGNNYGWIDVTQGHHYNNEPAKGVREVEGMTDPVIAFGPPSLNPGNPAWYAGALFPAWQGDLLLPSFTKGVLRIDFADGVPGDTEELLTGLKQRWRDARVAPDGSVYLLTDEAQGAVLRLTPSE